MNKKGIERFKMEERRFKIETHLRHDYPCQQKPQLRVGMDKLKIACPVGKNDRIRETGNIIK